MELKHTDANSRQIGMVVITIQSVIIQISPSLQ